MLRPVFGTVFRAVVVGRSSFLLQSNINSNRFLQCQASLQYCFPRRNLIAATKFLVTSASNSLKYSNSHNNNNGLLRKVMQRRCSGGGGGGGGKGQTSNSTAEGSSGSSSNTAVAKLSLFAKFKQMYKDYWYVMVPVHLVTSAGWFGVFYYVSTSGTDVGAYLRKLGVSENIVHHITDSKMGHIAVAWALYKIATPARYAVTIGGTTVSINVLRNLGYIKPAKELMAQGRTKIQAAIKEQLPKK